MMKMMDKAGDAIGTRSYESLYKASQDTGISLGALRNARDKGNTVVVRRSDKVPFGILWSDIHKRCFEKRKEDRRLAEREKELKEEAKRKEMLSKMTPGELVEFKRKEKEERNKRDIEVSKRFNRIFGPKY